MQKLSSKTKLILYMEKRYNDNHHLIADILHPKIKKLLLHQYYK